MPWAQDSFVVLLGTTICGPPKRKKIDSGHVPDVPVGLQYHGCAPDTAASFLVLSDIRQSGHVRDAAGAFCALTSVEAGQGEFHLSLKKR